MTFAVHDLTKFHRPFLAITDAMIIRAGLLDDDGHNSFVGSKPCFIGPPRPHIDFQIPVKTIEQPQNNIAKNLSVRKIRSAEVFLYRHDNLNEFLIFH